MDFFTQIMRSSVTLAASTPSIQTLASPEFSKVVLVTVSKELFPGSITCKRMSTYDQTAPVKSLFLDLSPATVAGTNFVSRDHMSVNREDRVDFSGKALVFLSISLYGRLSTEPPNMRTLL